jgi:hypothetical protein
MQTSSQAQTPTSGTTTIQKSGRKFSERRLTRLEEVKASSFGTDPAFRRVRPTRLPDGWVDQVQTWDEFDGIKIAVVGLLSGGISGFSILHSDTGGFVAEQFDGRVSGPCNFRQGVDQWRKAVALRAAFPVDERLGDLARTQQTFLIPLNGPVGQKVPQACDDPEVCSHFNQAITTYSRIEAFEMCRPALLRFLGPTDPFMNITTNTLLMCGANRCIGRKLAKQRAPCSQIHYVCPQPARARA